MGFLTEDVAHIHHDLLFDDDRSKVMKPCYEVIGIGIYLEISFGTQTCRTPQAGDGACYDGGGPERTAS